MGSDRVLPRDVEHGNSKGAMPNPVVATSLLLGELQASTDARIHASAEGQRPDQGDADVRDDTDQDRPPRCGTLLPVAWCTPLHQAVEV